MASKPFDAEALKRIGESMVKTYKDVKDARQQGLGDDDIEAQVFRGMGQGMFEDYEESKYLQQEEGGILSDFLGTLSKDPRGWRGERSPREYGIPSPMDAFFGGRREQLELEQQMQEQSQSQLHREHQIMQE